MPTVQDTSPDVNHVLPSPIVEVHPPSLHPVLVMDETEALKQAAERWLKQQKDVWRYIYQSHARLVRRYAYGATALRVAIITLTALLTTASTFQVAQGLVSITSGVLSVLVGLEAFFKFSERSAQAQQQLRELQSCYDTMNSTWATEVQLTPAPSQRLERARQLLREAPKAYNDIFNKYAFGSGTEGLESSQK